MSSENKTLVENFIEEIWNQSHLEKIDNYLSANFVDYSLPPNFPADKTGIKLWIIGTSKSFVHKTIIDDIVSEENKVMMKIRMQLKHIGVWRNIEPTHFEIVTHGYRYCKLAYGKIIEHWALIDGNSIENQLTEASKGCKIQK